MSKYERGERRLDLIELDEICEALGTNLGRFVTRFKQAVKAEQAAARKLNQPVGQWSDSVRVTLQP